MSYIEGPNLWTAVADGDIRDDDMRLDVTYRIIRVAVELERHGFYHQDLKTTNIIRRHADGEIYFIDLAGNGLTEGMYREERESIIDSEGPDASDALFTLGRTIWELWTGDCPWRGRFSLDRIQNETARDIIRDCEEGNMESIAHLSEKYSPRHFVRPVSVANEECA
jgi:hypothetical protein